jgi:hypothetical protein
MTVIGMLLAQWAGGLMKGQGGVCKATVYGLIAVMASGMCVLS